MNTEKKIQLIQANLNQKVYEIPLSQFKPNMQIVDLIKNYADVFKHKNTLKIAGRVVAKRNNNLFFELMAEGAKIQCMCHDYKLNKYLDLGDYIGVVGYADHTKTGDQAVIVQQLFYVAKAEVNIPKYPYKITDEAASKVLTAITDPDLYETIKIRNLINRFSREYFYAKDFVEVETPYLQPIAGGAEAELFETYHNAANKKLYLRVAPELYLKSMSIMGMPKIFEIGKSFRNEGVSPKHSPEFTMLEAYEHFASLEDLIDLLKSYLSYLADKIKEKYPNRQLNLTDKLEWKVVTYHDAVAKALGLKTIDWTNLNQLKQLGSKVADLSQAHTSMDIADKVLDWYVTQSENRCVIITRHPASISPLSKRDPDNPEVTLRFEAFINGLEISNGYEELSNHALQAEIFEAQTKVNPNKIVDQRYIDDMRCGMPNVGGIGIGIDRVTMLLLGKTMKDILPFRQT